MNQRPCPENAGRPGCLHVPGVEKQEPLLYTGDPLKVSLSTQAGGRGAAAFAANQLRPLVATATSASGESAPGMSPPHVRFGQGIADHKHWVQRYKLQLQISDLA